jgi:hypothetical protein
LSLPAGITLFLLGSAAAQQRSWRWKPCIVRDMRNICSISLDHPFGGMRVATARVVPGMSWPRQQRRIYKVVAVRSRQLGAFDQRPKVRATLSQAPQHLSLAVTVA